MVTGSSAHGICRALGRTLRCRASSRGTVLVPPLRAPPSHRRCYKLLRRGGHRPPLRRLTVATEASLHCWLTARITTIDAVTTHAHAYRPLTLTARWTHRHRPRHRAAIDPDGCTRPTTGSSTTSSWEGERPSSPQSSIKEPKETE